MNKLNSKIKNNHIRIDKDDNKLTINREYNKNGKIGNIAMIPIGLQTVGSVIFDDPYKNINQTIPIQRTKEEKLGHFVYDGSTVLLIFEKNKLSSLSVQQGNVLENKKN